MNVSQMKELLELFPEGIDVVSIGRGKGNVSLSIPATQYAELVSAGFPPGWERATEPKFQSKDGYIRIICKGF